MRVRWVDGLSCARRQDRLTHAAGLDASVPDHASVAAAEGRLDDKRTACQRPPPARGQSGGRFTGKFASVVQDSIRCFVSRLGGDEFAIVLNADGHQAAVAVAQRTLAVFQDPLVISATVVTVGCSIGVAISDAEVGANTAEELIRNADFAMYMAKSQGKNRFEVFASTLHDDVLGRANFKNDLAYAVPRGQFILKYQPVVELETRALLGFEALIRWQHPTRGLLAPSEFIALAEVTGDIVAIGEWVINEACHELAEHHRQQEGHQRPLSMSACRRSRSATPGFSKR